MRSHLARTVLLTILLVTLIVIISPVNSVSWSPTDTQLTTAPQSDFSAAITQTPDERIWIFWHRIPPGKIDADVFCKTYDGTTWSDETRLISDSTNDINTAPLFARDGTFWIFWTADVMGSNNYRIFYKTSSDNGQSWSTKTLLTNTTYSDRRPSVMQATDGKIWVLWHSKRDGSNDLYYKVYDGQSWSDDTQLTFDSQSDHEGSIMQARNGTIFVFWSSYRTGDYEIFYKTLSNNGESWSAETQLTDAPTNWDELPSAMQARDGKIWLFWASHKSTGNYDYDIYYKTFDGSNWSSDTLFAGYSTTDETLPSVFQATNKTIWVAWSSNIGSGDSDFDIWYRLTIPYDHDVGIASVTSSRSILYRGFETQVQINVDVWNYGLNTESLTVAAYYNSTKIGNQTLTLPSNSHATLTFAWNPQNVPYGYYTVRAEVSPVTGESDTVDNRFTDGRVTVTIAGDINGDMTVNGLDLTPINAHWYDPPLVGLQGYDANADINNDGRVNLFDAAIINVNFDRSW